MDRAVGFGNRDRVSVGASSLTDLDRIPPPSSFPLCFVSAGLERRGMGPSPTLVPSSTVATGTLATRSKIVRDEIKWLELLSHFRSVQLKHEKSRRTGLGGGTGDSGSTSGFSVNGETVASDRSGSAGISGGKPSASSGAGSRPVPRRKASASGAPGALSPLNPRSKLGTAGGVYGGPNGASSGGKPPVGRPMSPPLAEKQRRVLGLRKL